MSGRQRFRCVVCKLLVEGREMPNGDIVAYDRAGYDGTPERPALCVTCAERKREGCTTPECQQFAAEDGAPRRPVAFRR